MTSRTRFAAAKAAWPTTHPTPFPASPWVAAALRVALARHTTDRPHPVVDTAPLPSVPTGEQWPQVLEAIRRHRVVPTIGNIATELGLTDQQRAELHAAHRTSAGLALMVVAATRELCGALGDAGLRVLAIKGPVLALAQGRTIAERGGGDVDLWVHPDDIAAAATVVGACGWRAVPNGVPHEGWRQRVGRWVVQETQFVQVNRPPVDLHWRISRIGNQLPLTFDDAWQRSAEVGDPMPLVHTLGPTDMLVHLCTHATSDAFTTLSQVYDVATLAHALSPGLVASAARQSMPVAVAVSVAANLDPRLSALVPDNRRIRRLARWGWDEALAARLRRVDRSNNTAPGAGTLRATMLAWQVASSRTPRAAAGVLADPVLARTVLAPAAQPMG